MLDLIIETYGLNTCLAAIELPKSTWYYQKKEKVVYVEKYKELKRPVMDVIRANPGYGYRRILPELHDGGYWVGGFVLRRMLKRWDLELLRTIRPACSRQGAEAVWAAQISQAGEQGMEPGEQD